MARVQNFAGKRVVHMSSAKRELVPSEIKEIVTAAQWLDLMTQIEKVYQDAYSAACCFGCVCPCLKAGKVSKLSIDFANGSFNTTHFSGNKVIYLDNCFVFLNLDELKKYQSQRQQQQQQQAVTAQATPVSTNSFPVVQGVVLQQSQGLPQQQMPFRAPDPPQYQQPQMQYNMQQYPQGAGFVQAPQQQQVQTVQVVIPPGYGPGSAITITGPDGRIIQCSVPNVSAGSTVYYQYNSFGQVVSTSLSPPNMQPMGYTMQPMGNAMQR